MQKGRRSLAGVAIGLMAAGYASGCTPVRCSIAGPNWPDHVGPWLPDGEPSYSELRVKRGGQLEWSGSGLWGGDKWHSIGPDELQELLRIADSMQPRPVLIVDVSPDADCASVRAAAARLQRLPACRSGHCLERSAWENYSGGEAR